jgi:hypothetical protein
MKHLAEQQTKLFKIARHVFLRDLVGPSRPHISSDNSFALAQNVITLQWGVVISAAATSYEVARACAGSKTTGP